ncbi:host-nuclease inhibitor Gam family protein [Neisseria perflava]|uniref:host-nuclease inhibitor Gam family protein n=1 Tax=Neisseria perflava TaxID=33053 RepID=UPI00209E694F|nr:host-nuclease inhibitor Gam family protein [Neisseria perflava]MCP1659312.1 phage host-nuclease inhibitor protein Gam [Neisseria perflava]
MAKTNRIKKAAIEAAQDKGEVTLFIRRIGDAQREVKRLETEAGDKKALIEEEYAALAAPHIAEILSLTERVAAYCEAHKDELTEGGKSKTADFTTGLVKWRIRPPSVKVTGVAAVLAWLKEKTAYAEFVRTKHEIDKDAILNQKERFAEGQVPGIKIVSGVEDFVIEPTEQELA